MSQSLTQLRQSMTWLHTWSGLVLGWLLFFIFLTGTLGYFDTEIDRWMKPELPKSELIDPMSSKLPNGSDYDYGKALGFALHHAQQQAVGATCWNIGFPQDRNDPYLRLFFRGANTSNPNVPYSTNRLLINPENGEIYPHRDTGGGQTLYKMHWKLHYLPKTTAEWIVGIATLFMLVALISGIIIHKRFFKDFFLFTQNKGKRSWLEAHKLVGVISLPFHLMITYTGLVFLMTTYLPWMISSFYGSTMDFQKDTTASSALMVKAKESAQMTDVIPLFYQAQTILADKAPELKISSACVRAPGDKNMRIVFRADSENVLEKSFHAVVFHGVTGEFIEYEPPERSAAKTLKDTLLGLHEATFASWPLRWLFFIAGLLGSAMIATGLILWAKRQSQKLGEAAENHRGLWWVERLNVATIIGLPTAIAAYFIANRLLPIEMASRADWEVHVMFIVWSLLLVHTLIRPKTKLWFEQLSLAALAYLNLPILNALTTDRGLIPSLTHNDWVFVGLDLSFLVCGAVFAWLALRLLSANQTLPAGNQSPVQSLKAKQI